MSASNESTRRNTQAAVDMRQKPRIGKTRNKAAQNFQTQSDIIVIDNTRIIVILDAQNELDCAVDAASKQCGLIKGKSRSEQVGRPVALGRKSTVGESAGRVLAMPFFVLSPRPSSINLVESSNSALHSSSFSSLLG